MNAAMIAAALVAMTQSASKDAPSLPAFEFRGMTAGQEADPAVVKKCRAQEDGARICYSGYDKVAGVRVFAMLAIYNNKLSYLGFSGDRTVFTPLLAAFREKYGEPCSTKIEKWQSRGGITLDNTVVEWCFSTGSLRLSEVGSRVDQTNASYIDQNQPPRQKPKVDF